ncbi:MAG: 6-carboxytetrahydropterin synthase [Candidatus Thermoplasmatota archaeon]
MEKYVYIDGWKSKIRFSAAHVIPEYEKCGRLHGHSYAIHAKIYGEPDEKGIIIDFSVLKEKLKEIADKLDHRILVPLNNEVTNVEKDNNSVKINQLNKSYKLPLQDCLLLPLDSVSAEKISHYILQELIQKLKDHFKDKNIYKIEIGVDEGYGQGARLIKKL